MDSETSFSFWAIGFSTRGVKTETQITSTEYERMKRVEAVCLSAIGMEERFRLVFKNYEEWERELLIQAQSMLIWSATEHSEQMECRLDLDRRFLNVLTALRLYQDHSDHLLAEVMGRTHPHRKALKAIKARLYDSHLGYRILESLRNFVQHQGLPVSSITYTIERVETKWGGQLQVTNKPTLWPKNLSGFKVKKAVLVELLQKGEKIDLRPFTREYMSCLIELHSEIRTLLTSTFQANFEAYARALAKYSMTDHAELRHPRLQCRDSEGEVVDDIHLTRDVISLNEKLLFQNSRVQAFVSSFVSNVAGLSE